MTRKFALFLLTAALAATSCSKLKHVPFLEKKPTPETAAAAQSAAGAPAATPPPAPKPDLLVAPAAPAKPELNKHSSTIVLCYHNIEEKGGSKALTITTTEFEKEMKEVKDNGFTVIPMQDFLAFRRGDKEIPAKSCVVTIDDGWVSAYNNAWPVLKKFGYPFTLFIYIDYVGTGGKSMTWDQLAEMRDAGVDIQSHTYSHSNLRKPGGSVDKKTHDRVMKDLAELGHDGWLRKEIVESGAVLEKQLGIKCNAFAYPFGIYNSEARAMVKEAGYEAAFTVYGQQLRFNSPPSDLLGRYAVEAAKPEIFANAMKMIGGGVTTEDPMESTSVAQLASASMVTQPMDGETISDPRPTIKANLATMGQVDPASVQIRLSGIGLLKVKYDSATGMAEAKVTKPLSDPNYSVILTATADGKKAEIRWGFNFSKDGKTSAPEMDAPPKRDVPPTAPPVKAPAKKR